MGNASLSFHDDDLGFRFLVGANDFRLELADHEVAFDGVERHAVGGTLHEAGLPGRDEGRGDSLLVQGVGEEERGRPLADRPVRPEDRDPETGKLAGRSEEHTSELQSLTNLVCRLLLEKKKNTRPDTEKNITATVQP